jgi:hypothetical protein
LHTCIVQVRELVSSHNNSLLTNTRKRNSDGSAITRAKGTLVHIVLQGIVEDSQKCGHPRQSWVKGDEELTDPVSSRILDIEC